jgi:hypothetical protein
MINKEALQTRLNEINLEINKLHEEGVKIVGKLELITEQEKEEKEAAK